MKINKIHISNILGIKELSFEPGLFTEITGRNGTGKTSVLESIKAALKSGNDATLLRNGAEQGEIVLVLDDGFNIYKSIKNGKSNLKYISPAGEEVKAPQSQIDKLIDMLSVNPVSFMLSDKKSRTKVLLETLNLRVTREELAKAIDNDVAPIDTDRNALDVINELYQEQYDSRRSYNRDASEKKNSISQLEESLVELDFEPNEVLSQINSLEAKKMEWAAKKDNYLAKIINESKNRIEELRIEFERKREEILRDEKQKTDNLHSSFQEKISSLNDSLSQYKERLKFAGAALKTKELIEQYRKEFNTLAEMSDECTTKMMKLEALKLSLLDKLPVKGLEVKDNEIYKDGVVFDRLNTAEQIKIAVEVSKLRAGDLGLVCIDGIERFDNETYSIFKEEMTKTNLQTIITKVSDEELAIRN